MSAGRSARALNRVGLAFAVLLSSPALAAAESVCYGTTANGRLENGVPLPAAGANFVSYGSIPETAGRTYVHSKVRDVIVDAYRRLEREQPGKVFKYAETGFRDGGRFKPHKTHRNGLSPDFVVPVTNGAGQSVHLPTNPFNKYGYGIEFDRTGHYDGYSIDYEDMSMKKLGVGLALLALLAGLLSWGLGRRQGGVGDGAPPWPSCRPTRLTCSPTWSRCRRRCSTR